MQLTRRPLRLAPDDSDALPLEIDRTAGIITLIGAGSAILSAFVPWIETATLGISLIKIDAPGVLLAALAATSISIACFVLLRRPAKAAAAIILIVLGAAQVGLAVWHLADIIQATSQADSHLVLISLIGTGLYLGVLGSVIALAGGVLAWTTRSSLQT